MRSALKSNSAEKRNPNICAKFAGPSAGSADDAWPGFDRELEELSLMVLEASYEKVPG
jgi:hypothetical protein